MSQEKVITRTELDSVIGRLPNPNDHHNKEVVVPIMTHDFTDNLVRVLPDKGDEEVMISVREIKFIKHKVNNKYRGVEYIWKLDKNWELLIM